MALQMIDPREIDLTGNPREVIDDERFATLVANVREHGVINPVSVVPHENGGKLKFRVVDGKRRVLAARKAKLLLIAADVQDRDDPLSASVSANLHRDPLRPLEEAKAFGLASKTMTVPQIAKAYSVSEDFVRGRLTLVALPVSLHHLVDENKMTIAAARTIVTIAAHSAALGEAVAAAILAETISAGQLASNPGWAFKRIVDEGGSPVTAFNVHGYNVDVDTLPWTDEQKDMVRAHTVALKDAYVYDQLLTKQDVEAARQYGALLEIPDDTGRHEQLITDPEWLFEHVLPRLEKAARKAVSKKVENGQRVSAADLPVDLQEERRKARDAERGRRVEAIADNQTLGVNLSTRLKPRFDKQTMRLLALLLFDKWETLAARGPRYTVDVLRSAEETKSGTVKITYADATASREWFRQRLDRCKTAEEILHHVLFLLLSAEFADEDAVAQSNRSFASEPGYGQPEVKKILLALGKSLLPDRVKARRLQVD